MNQKDNNNSTVSGKLSGLLLKKSVGSPLVAYPTMTAGLGGIAGVLFGFGVLPEVMLVGGLTLALAGFIAEFGVRRDSNLKSIMIEASRQMERQRDNIIAILLEEIDDKALPSARLQLTEFKGKFETFVDVLDDRFNPGELTFVRYMSVAEQVYLSGLDNLRNAVISSKAIQSTDISSLKARLEKLGTSATDEIEKSALRERIKGSEETISGISNLLVLNEKALAVLDSVTQKLARTQVSKGMADGDTESAIAELGRMGEMLARYANS